jgi:hypothetical protein
MPSDARERMPSILVLVKIIALFPRRAAREDMRGPWVRSMPESADGKCLFRRLFAPVIASAVPQCQWMTESLLSLEEAKPDIGLVRRRDAVSRTSSHIALRANSSPHPLLRTQLTGKIAVFCLWPP